MGVFSDCWAVHTDSGATMPASRGGRLRRKGCSLARRTQRQATAAWRLLYRLLFMVSKRTGDETNIYAVIFR